MIEIQRRFSQFYVEEHKLEIVKYCHSLSQNLCPSLPLKDSDALFISVLLLICYNYSTYSNYLQSAPPVDPKLCH